MSNMLAYEGPTYIPLRFTGRTGYQIFVDRFCRVGPPPNPMPERTLKNWEDDTPNWMPDEDGEYRNLYFYGGNLKGIISKLDAIKELGFDLIYLSPISFSHSSHHYDVEDQRIIDPWIGTWDDFKELCKTAHEKDILICVDLVFNHMGIKSKFFNEAVQNEQSVYHSWFEWDRRGNPVFWYGFKDMPQCNKLNPEYQEYAYQVCEHYIHMGADGIRLDLGENFPQQFMQSLRKRVKAANPEVLIVSEMWDFATHKENPQIYGDQADSVMNYPMADAILRWLRYGNEKHFEYTLRELGSYPEQVQDVLWNFLDSHDTPRASNMLTAIGMNENPYSGRIWDIESPWRKDDQFDTFEFRNWEFKNDYLQAEDVRNKLMLSSLLQYFVRGVPVVYYGTEAGSTGYKDPFNRKPYPWNNQDEVLIKHYTSLGMFRKQNQDILKQGKLVELRVNSSTLLMVREIEDKALVLVMNRTSESKPSPIYNWNIDGWKQVFKVKQASKHTLAPYSAIVYRVGN